MNEKEVVNNTDFISRMANGLFNISAAGVLCWLVVSELPRQRESSAAQHVAVLQEFKEISKAMGVLATEIKLIQRDRLATDARKVLPGGE